MDIILILVFYIMYYVGVIFGRGWGCYGGSDKVGLRKKSFERSNCQGKWDLGEINKVRSLGHC